MEEEMKMLEETVSKEYEFGFVTNIKTDVIRKGIDEEVIRLISSKKNEPESVSSRIANLGSSIAI
jgi:Fe-S cluster assembly protein SufB